MKLIQKFGKDTYVEFDLGNGNSPVNKSEIKGAAKFMLFLVILLAIGVVIEYFCRYT
jgi:hypothetical protein